MQVHRYKPERIVRWLLSQWFRPSLWTSTSLFRDPMTLKYSNCKQADATASFPCSTHRRVGRLPRSSLLKSAKNEWGILSTIPSHRKWGSHAMSNRWMWSRSSSHQTIHARLANFSNQSVYLQRGGLKVSTNFFASLGQSAFRNSSEVQRKSESERARLLAGGPPFLLIHKHIYRRKWFAGGTYCWTA